MKSGWVWTRVAVMETPVGEDWNGEGIFDSGESEDYLLRVQDYIVVPISDWAIYLGLIMMTIFTVFIIRRRFFR
jgi:hypothetical protein